MTSCRDEGIRPGPCITVHPPDAQGRRRVHADGQPLRRATGPRDLMEFLRRADLDPDDVDLDDTALIDWRGGGPAAWSPAAERP
ncbi:hypothetical protein EF912_31365 [Streptomyces sp. WAC07061]|uniref:hypothetical protein n=1 Tax=Streptomyces sp. WAC07061 TaxID=2487410 RepID=UPI000F76E69E|nr:hypothetical protein [Streptomyces sp. WAC07061]RSS41591.1 hypothetical protein EF912_31365 [Streptomyces sp. WAC07061]